MSQNGWAPNNWGIFENPTKASRFYEEDDEKVTSGRRIYALIMVLKESYGSKSAVKGPRETRHGITVWLEGFKRPSSPSDAHCGGD